MPAGPKRRVRRWLVPGGPGTVRSISVADDGTCAIAYEAPRHLPDSDCEVRGRSGDALEIGLRISRQTMSPDEQKIRSDYCLEMLATCPTLSQPVDDHPRWWPRIAELHGARP